MGGEKWPILVYGSKERRTMKEWLIKLGIVHISKFAQKLRDSENSEYSYTDEELFMDCYEDNDDDVERLFDFVENNGLTIIYFDNYNWEEFSIGLEVKEYEKITNEEKDKIKKFCDTYNLGDPTYYAGMIGEYE